MRLHFPQLGLLLHVEEERAERGGQPVALSPLSRRLLTYLAYNRDRVVPGEELMREVWTGVHVTDASLRQGLRILRRELAPEARNGAVVQAVRGVGYRLATAVEELAAEAPGDLPFVGRAEEMGRLLHALEHVRSGTGRTILLSGPAGIGKTRLSEEVAWRAARRGFLALAGACAAADAGAPPLWPFEEVLRTLGDADPRWLDRVSAAEQRALRSSLSFLAPGADSPADRLAPGPTRFRLFEAVRCVLAQTARSRPLVVRLDDIHEADDTSLALLEWLSGRMGDVPLMLLLTQRSPLTGEAPPRTHVLAPLLRAAAMQRMVLGPLDRAAVERAAHTIEPGAEPARMEDLWSASGGNPFFLRLALESGARTRGSADPRVSPGPREAVLAQLDVLSESTRSVVAAASVLGVEFPTGVLARILDQSRESVDRALAEAGASGFVSRRDEQAAAFVHALVQEALYEDLDLDRRRGLHARAADAFEALEPVPVSAVAEHAFRARGVLPDDRIALRCADAARAAAERMGLEQATRLLERALACTALNDSSRRLELLLELAEAKGREGDVAGAEAASEEAALLADASGNAAARGRAELALAAVRGATTGRDQLEWVERLERALAGEGLPAATRARLLSHLAKALWLTPPPERARDLARRSIEFAEQSGDPDALAGALAAAWLIFQTGRDDAEARRGIAERMEAAAAAKVRDRLLVQEMLAYLSVEAGRRGDRAGVEARSARIQQEAERVGGPHAAWWASVARTTVEQLRGRSAEAEFEADHGLELGLALGLPVAVPNHALQMLAIRRDQGRLGELEPLLAQGAVQQPNEVPWTAAWRLAGLHAGATAPALELLDGLCEQGLDRLPLNVGYVALLAMLAELAYELDHRETARQLRPLLAPFRAEHVFFGLGFCHWGAAIHYLGRTALLLGDFDAAVAELEAGVRADRAMGAPLPAARGQAVLSRARLRRDAPGDREQAEKVRERSRALEEDLGVRIRELR